MRLEEEVYEFLFEGFNPRTHAGCDDMLLLIREDMIEVSIHAPTQGATQCNDPVWNNLKVSIHAPTQGATRGDDNCNRQIQVSIHAPTQGATL